jgi:acyl-CoA synthetase (AMP-forming)/AMP-acid ligase II
MNIIEPILFQCRQQPPVAAICVPGPGVGLISYRRLALFIHNIGRRLAAAGLRPGQLVAVNIEDQIFHIAMLLALTRLGIASVSVRGPGRAPLPLDAFVTDKTLPAGLVDRVILADLSWTEGEGLAVDAAPVRPDDLCRVVLTSGTTGDPKGVPISHRLLADRVARHTTVFGARLADYRRIYSDMPVTTSLGFQFLIATLARGGTYFLPDDSFETTLKAMEQYRVQCVLAPPSGLELLLKWFEATPAYQSNLEVVLSAGDLLSEALSRRVRARMCSHLVSVYGSTEASITATAPTHVIDRIPGAVGYLTPGVRAQIVDRDGVVLPPEREGLLRIRSEFAVDRYLGEPAGSERVFRDGWFHPGDLATLDAEGLLVIAGRDKTVLNLGGDKVSPEVVEAAVGAFPGIAEVAVTSLANSFGIHEVVAVIVCKGEIDAEALGRHCAARLSSQFVPAHFVVADRLPRNDMGKIDRHQLAEGLRAARAGATANAT